MKATALLLLACCALTLATHASEPVLWAFDMGPGGGLGVTETICLDPLASFSAEFPPGRDVMQDASYDVTSSLLYVTGGNEGELWYYQNTVFVYSGGPEGLTFVSSSNAGMDDYHWPGGITLLGDSLYAVAFTGYFEDNVLIRIDNPGTAAQTVTQIGPALGATEDMGVPYNLCPDGQGALLSMFRPAPTERTLYRLDPATGVATPLHTYSLEIGEGTIEALALLDDDLYGINMDGDLWRLDLDTYDPTFLGTIGFGVWIGLVPLHAPPCPGDVDGNGIVDGLDLTAVLTAWETVPGDPLWNENADLDDNNIVDGLDLTEVISNWTTAPPPIPEPST